jgi:hypothetical protein
MVDEKESLAGGETGGILASSCPFPDWMGKAVDAANGKYYELFFFLHHIDPRIDFWGYVQSREMNCYWEDILELLPKTEIWEHPVWSALDDDKEELAVRFLNELCNKFEDRDKRLVAVFLDRYRPNAGYSFWEQLERFYKDVVDNINYVARLLKEQLE